MHLAYISHVYNIVEKPTDLLDLYFTDTLWTTQLAKVGIKVSVLYRFHEQAYLKREGVEYYFFKDSLPPLLRKYHFAYKFYKQVAKFVQAHQVDLIHAHDTLAIASNFLLRRFVPKLPILVQDHTGVSKLTFPLLLRWSLKGIDRILFSAKGQEQIWVQEQVIRAESCRFVMEISSTFQYESREKARKKTALSGQPVFLWVGNLDSNKDPFTALSAFNSFLSYVPDAQLYMIFRLNHLQTEVETFIEQHPRLERSVHLLGSKMRDCLPDYYNSADYFLSASYKEGSGYAAIEAISCGVIPILSKIPSFEDLTNNGKIGYLFEAGNSDMLLIQLLKTQQLSITEAREQVLLHFQENLIFDVLIIKMKAFYEELI